VWGNGEDRLGGLVTNRKVLQKVQTVQERYRQTQMDRTHLEVRFTTTGHNGGEDVGQSSKRTKAPTNAQRHPKSRDKWQDDKAKTYVNTRSEEQNKPEETVIAI